MALRAGATLEDLEMVQFMPTSLVYPKKLKGVIVTDTLRGAGARLLNNQHERFMVKYAPEKMELATRDLVARAIYQEITEGRGTIHEGVYLDATHLDRQTVMQSFTNAPLMIAQGIDPCTEPIEVAPSAHFSCGGVVIDDSCFTGINGLWAAGEVCAGVHGANRLGANALTENLVFGAIAGQKAGQWALHSKKMAPQSCWDDKVLSLQNLPDGFSENLQQELEDLEKEIKDAVWQGAGIVREEDTLRQSVERLKRVGHILSKRNDGTISKEQYTYWRRLEGMAFLGEMLVESARSRKESRGVHSRLDYPDTDSIIRHTRISMDPEGILKYSFPRQ